MKQTKMKLSKAERQRQRVVFENAAQHLRHGGFSDAQISEFFGCAEDVARLLANAAEFRRPKQCAPDQLCGVCPYCKDVDKLNSIARVQPCAPSDHVVDPRDPDYCARCRTELGPLWGFPSVKTDAPE